MAALRASASIHDTSDTKSTVPDTRMIPMAVSVASGGALSGDLHRYRQENRDAEISIFAAGALSPQRMTATAHAVL
jgi:hypothetical protein